jgi:hypothetical protein
MPSSRLCLIPLLPQLADVPCAVVVGNAKGGMVPNIQLTQTKQKQEYKEGGC